MAAKQHTPPYVALAMLNPCEVSWTKPEKYSKEFLDTEQCPLVESGIVTISSFTDESSSAGLKPRNFLICIIRHLIVLSIFSPLLAFTSITKIMETYYQVNVMLVCCLSLIYCLVPILLIPVIHYVAIQCDPTLLAILCSIINTVGAAIRCIGTDRDGFFLLLLGQSITAASAAFYPFLQLPFNENNYQHSCFSKKFLYSFSCIDSLLGVSIGNLLSLQFINAKNSISEIGGYIYKYALGSAIFATAILVLLPFALKEADFRNMQPLYKSTNDIIHRPLSMPDTSLSNGSLLKQYIHCFKEKKRQIYVHTFGISFGLLWVTVLHFSNVIGKTAAEANKYVGLISFMSIILGICSVFVILKLLPRSLKWWSFGSLSSSGACTIGFILCASQELYKLSFSLFTISVILSLVHLTVSTLQIREDSLPVSGKYSITLFLHQGFIYACLSGAVGTLLLWKLNSVAFAIFIGMLYVTALAMILVRNTSQRHGASTESSA